jgi:hypothetical protein
MDVLILQQLLQACCVIVVGGENRNAEMWYGGGLRINELLFEYLIYREKMTNSST